MRPSPPPIGRQATSPLPFGSRPAAYQPYLSSLPKPKPARGAQPSKKALLSQPVAPQLGGTSAQHSAVLAAANVAVTTAQPQASPRRSPTSRSPPSPHRTWAATAANHLSPPKKAVHQQTPDFLMDVRRAPPADVSAAPKAPATSSATSPRVRPLAPSAAEGRRDPHAPQPHTNIKAPQIGFGSGSGSGRTSPRRPQPLSLKRHAAAAERPATSPFPPPSAAAPMAMEWAPPGSGKRCCPDPPLPFLAHPRPPPRAESRSPRRRRRRFDSSSARRGPSPTLGAPFARARRAAAAVHR